MTRSRPRVWLGAVIATAVAMGLLAAACGGTEIVTVVETVVVEKEVIREVEVIKEVEVMAKPEGYVHRALEPFPERGGVLKTSWGFILPHFDYHQGPSGQNWAGTLVNKYNGLIRRNPNDGMASIIPSCWPPSRRGL